MPSRPVHVHPTAELAPRALLPGDPGRALALAQVLLDAPRMFNHNRGLWGYTGEAADGAPLTIQATGLGGPSAAIVLAELCDLGLQVAVRIGTAMALGDAFALGDVAAVRTAVALDGTSRALGAGARVEADRALADALAGAAGREAVVCSSDLFGAPAAARAGGAALADLSTAAVLAVAARRGVRAGCVLAVAHGPGGARLGADGLVAAGEALGRVAAEGLGIAAATTAP